jgi:hypothetical protein
VGLDLDLVADRPRRPWRRRGEQVAGHVPGRDADAAVHRDGEVGEVLADPLPAAEDVVDVTPT